MGEWGGGGDEIIGERPIMSERAVMFRYLSGILIFFFFSDISVKHGLLKSASATAGIGSVVREEKGRDGENGHQYKLLSIPPTLVARRGSTRNGETRMATPVSRKGIMSEGTVSRGRTENVESSLSLAITNNPLSRPSHFEHNLDQSSLVCPNGS